MNPNHNPHLLPPVKVLYLEGNNIHTMPSRAFWGLSKLKELDIHQSRIKTLQNDTFEIHKTKNKKYTIFFQIHQFSDFFIIFLFSKFHEYFFLFLKFKLYPRVLLILQAWPEVIKILKKIVKHCSNH